MSNISEFSNIPEISFVDNMTLEQTVNEMITDFQDEYSRMTGEKIKIGQVNETRFIINALALQIYQLKQYVNTKGRLNFLKYSYGEFLDNAGVLRGITRKPATFAKTVLKFTASEISDFPIGIPGGTQCCNEDGVTFQTDEYVEIAPSEESVEVSATALVAGTASNNAYIGTISTMVDPVPYIDSVENVTVSAGAIDIESDDDFTLRIFKAPTSYSTAGPASAYESLVREYLPDAKTIKVTSPSPSVVNIALLLGNGWPPDETTVEKLTEFIENSDKKPLTDSVQVVAPETLRYDITLTYYINFSKSSQEQAIQTAVDTAIMEFASWQRDIGKDINPSELIARIINAGAKRVELTSPSFITVNEHQVPTLGHLTAIYGGLEDD